MADQSNQHNLHAQILIVDDEVEHANVMADALRKPGHVCTIVYDLAGAKEELLHGTFDVIVTDLVMEDQTTGLKVLALAKEHQTEAETIMVTAHGDVPTAKAALKGGAYDFIEKPLDLEVFRNLVNRAAQTVLLRHQNVRLQGQVDAAYGRAERSGDSYQRRVGDGQGVGRGGASQTFQTGRQAFCTVQRSVTERDVAGGRVVRARARGLHRGRS